MKKIVMFICFSLYSASSMAHMSPVTSHFYCTTYEGKSGNALIEWANLSVYDAGGTDLIASIINVSLTEQEKEAMHVINPFANNSISIFSEAILGDPSVNPEVTRASNSNLTLSVDDSLRATGTIAVDFSKLTEFPARIRELGVQNFTLKFECQKDVTF